MKVGKWQFRPTLWPTLVALVTFAVLIRLGVWQLHRADYKRGLLQQFHHNVQLVPRDVMPAAANGQLNKLSRYRHVEARGHYDAAHQLLLNEMQHGDAVGYEVLTPFVLAPGQQIVMVDRGWLAKSANAKLPSLPLASDARRIRGIIGFLPVPGIRLGKNTVPDGWPKLLLYPRYPTLEKLYGGKLLHPVIWLDPDQADGYARDWRPNIGFPPIRHTAYALQWFAMALAVAVIWIVVNLKRGQNDDRNKSD